MFVNKTLNKAPQVPDFGQQSCVRAGRKPEIRMRPDTIGTMGVKKQHEKRFSSSGFPSTVVILRKIAYNLISRRVQFTQKKFWEKCHEEWKKFRRNKQLSGIASLL